MNTYKRKVLTSAVLAGLGVAGSAHAIYQDPNGTGSFMIYPYYTVNSVDGAAYNTYITIVNPTTFTKVVRFRAREGRASIEVRDFNVYLSPNDVWTAAIVPTDGGGARVITADNSCTMPVLPTISTGLRGIDFTNILYSTGGVEFRAGIGTGLDRLREGYIEMIELATFDPAGASAALTVHNQATDTPPCGAALLSATPATPPPIATEALPPTGGLNGTGTLLHVPTGRAMGYNAVALANWSDGVPQFGVLADDLPNLGDSIPTSVVVGASVGTNPASALDGSPGTLAVYRADWLNGFEAAASTMMHTNVINEFVLENATRSNTDWVLTFPAKRGFVDTLGVAAVAPFTAKFLATVGACEAVTFTFFNREERGQPVQAGGFSPGGAAAGGGGTLCWESTVLSIRNGASHTPASGATTSGVLGSVNVTGVDITPGIQAGWGNLQFVGTNASTGVGLVSQATSNTIILPQDGVTAPSIVTAAQTFLGLPVTGFAVWDRTNVAVTCGTAGCMFGELHDHKCLNFNTPT